jgi:phage tail-like protein
MLGALGTTTSYLGGLALGGGYPIPLDVFETDPGVDAGRIEPVGVVPEDGSYVFCLGHDAPGYTGFVQPGDASAIAQTDTLPAGNLLTFQAVTRGPSRVLPAGYYWQADVLIDNVSAGHRMLAGDAPVAWDWDVDVALLAGSHTVAFQLSFHGPSLPAPPTAADPPVEPPILLPVLEVEIPGFYVDALVFSTAIGPLITNEVPVSEQGEGDGPAPADTTAIDFDVFGLGHTVTATSIGVTVNGQPAVVAGVVQAGFTGSVGATAEVVHVTVTPIAPFASNSVVTVAVTATNAVPVTHTRTWTFQVADITPPLMTSVVAIASNQIQVTWSKAISLVSPESAHDGTNPTLYYVTAVQPDAVTPAVSGGPVGDLIYTPPPYLTVESVTVINASSPSVVVLTLSDDLSPSIPYLVTEVGVEDLVGNFTTSVAGSTAFTPPAPAGRYFNLYRFLPLMNRQEDVTQDLLKFLNCLQDPTNLLLYDVDTWTEIFSITQAPDPFLTAMLADLGNPFPFVLSTEGKRKLLTLLVAIYEQKGTGLGIINAVRFFLGITITISTYDSSGNWILGESTLGEDGLSPLGFNATVVSYATGIITLGGLFGIGPDFEGRSVTITGASSGGNNGTFTILTADGTEITYANPSGVSPDAHDGAIGWAIVPDATAPGSCVLAPGTSFALYAFTISSAIDLTDTQLAQIEFIANYMKPAHTHLLGVVTPTSPVVYDPVELGISELGVDWILHA